LWLRNIATNSNTQVAPASFDRYRYLAFSPDSNYLYFVRAEPHEIGVSSLYRMPVLGGSVDRAVHNIGFKVTFSPDGSQIAFARYTPKTGLSEIVTASTDGSQEKVLYSGTTYIQSPAWSTDGKFLVCSAYQFVPHSTSSIIMIDIASGQQKALINSDSQLDDPQWMPDGKNLLVLNNTPETNFNAAQLAIVSYPEGKLRAVTKDTNSYLAASISSNGKTIATVQGQEATAVQVASYSEKGAAKPVTISERPPTDDISWTPGGQLLANQEGSLYQMDADGGNRRTLLHDNFASFAPISCDNGKYVVFSSALRANGSGITIWKMDAAGGNLKQITSGINDTPAMCSPDGKWLVYSSLTDGKFVSKKVSMDGGTPVQLSEAVLTCGCINISPDGKQLAYQTQPATGGPVVIQILDFETLKPIKNVERDPRAVGEIRYTMDGKAIGYPVRDKGQYALWISPIDGSPGKTVTDFGVDYISDFHWNADNTKLVLVRLHNESDVVLLKESASAK
jgi:Tol biopolymer transport system component